MSRKRSPHLGGTLEDLQTEAIKEVIVWQLTKAMKVRKLSKARMAILLKTSRTQINRLLDPTHDITEYLQIHGNLPARYRPRMLAACTYAAMTQVTRWKPRSRCMMR